MDLRIKLDGNADKNVKYASKHIYKWFVSALGDKAHEYRDFARKTFTSYLENRTGETVDSINTWIPKRERKSQNPKWYIRPGVNIPGMLNYLSIWVGTSRDFMNLSFEAWMLNADIAGYMERQIEDRFNNLKGTK